MQMIRIPQSIYQRMIEHAQEEWPLECCGILGGQGETVQKAFELQNSEESSVRFSMLPLEQLRTFEEIEKGSMEMIAVYHSHPHTISFPSEIDVKWANDPKLTWVILSLKEQEKPVVHAFKIDKDAIYLEKINIIEEGSPEALKTERE